jgi:hypothetical protein
MIVLSSTTVQTRRASVWRTIVQHRLLARGVVAALVVTTLGGDLLACGDKFLVGSRGTRYQRPKNARAAMVLIYAAPESALAADLKKVKVDSVLKHEGHRATTVQSLDQLSTVLAGGRFDVVLAASSESQAVERLIGAAPDAAVVVALEGRPKQGGLLKAIDKAVEQRDQNLKRAQSTRVS